MKHLQKNILCVCIPICQNYGVVLSTKVRMSYRNIRRAIQTGMPLDFVDEKELPGLGNVASNIPTFRVSPADQLHVQE